MLSNIQMCFLPVYHQKWAATAFEGYLVSSVGKPFTERECKITDTSFSFIQKSGIRMLLNAGLKNEGNNLIPSSWELIWVLVGMVVT